MKPKIKHPFHVPEDFFNDFREEMKQEIKQVNPANKRPILNLLPSVLKYAAIIILSFLLGRLSTNYFNHRELYTENRDGYMVDEVLSQVSVDDITEFFMENGSLE
jgi:hypothetical protein